MSGLPSVASDPIFAFSAEVAVKSALVLSVAALAGVALRKAHPAARHRAWALGLLLAAAVPALVLALPGLPLPSGVSSWFSTPSAATFKRTERAVASPELSAEPSEPTDRRASEPGAVAPPAAPPRRAMSWVAFAALLARGWVAGSIALLGRITLCLLRARAVARRGRPIDVPEFSAALEALGITRPVRLVESDAVKVPMTGGTLRPVLIVPAGFTDWTPECRRLVLLHELAHVRRGDFLLNLVCEVALALHWFQPLAWLAVRRVREEAEVAADDVVIGTGAVPSTYAAHLLAIVQGLPRDGGAPLLTVAMGASPIERRLTTILAPGRRIGGWRARPSIAILAVVLTGILAATRLGATPLPNEKKATQASGSARGASADELAAAIARGVRTAAARAEHFVMVAHNKAINAVHSQFRSRAKKEVGEDSNGGGNDSERGEAAFDRAQELHQTGEYKQAIQAWQDAIRLGYREETAAYNLACSEARLGETDRALAALASAIDAGFEAGEYLDHDQDLESLRADPRFRKLREEQGVADRERALAKLERVERSAPKDAGRCYEIGQELHAMGEYDAAARAWRKCLETDPGNANAAYNVACAEARKGDSNAALKDLERAIALGFSDADHLAEDGDLAALRADERFKELVETARDLELPDGAFSVMGWGGGAKQWREAKLRYERQLELHPESGRAWFNLGFARLRLGEPSGAVEAYRSAFEKGYRPGASAYNVACGYAALHDANQAFEWLDRARAAGLDVDGMIASDSDLESLRNDPRFPKVECEPGKQKREPGEPAGTVEEF